ncbi:MAG: hypothetical protein IPO27_03350 [Bacteroidetes bacterium]|nr:hypothetical protein [Bacteroidota bacterium]
MKKFTLRAVWALVLVAGIFQIGHAQLTGTYTIGGSAPNYATFTAAVQDLTSQGVSGAVVFNVRDGSYAEQISIGNITGASAANTITFTSENSDSTLVTLTHTSGGAFNLNHTVELNNAHYVSFTEMTIKRTGVASNGVVISIFGGSSDCSFSNCVLASDNTTSLSINEAIVNSPNTNGADFNLHFANNNFSNGSYGLYLFGPAASLETGLMVSNNLFNNQQNTSIQAYYNQAATIAGNKFSTTSTGFGAAINLSFCGGNILVEKNKIENITQGNGVQIGSCTATAGNEIKMYNNFISVNGNNNLQSYGINISSSSNIQVYNNNINMPSTAAVANNSAIKVTGSGISGLSIKFNMVVAPTGYVVNSALGAITEMDFNVLYHPGNFGFGLYDGLTVNTLNAWKSTTSLDANSLSADPQFTSVSDLHVANFNLNNLAKPVAGITTDIDNEQRDPVFPDIGADEFSAPGFDVGVKTFSSPFDSGCGAVDQVIGVVLTNYAFDAQTNFNVQVNVTGMGTANITQLFVDTLLPNDNDTMYVSTGINTSAGGSINVTAYTLLNGDNDMSNDSSTASFVLIAIPAPPTANPTTAVCKGDSATVSVTALQNHSVAWYSSPSNPKPLGIGNPFKVLVDGTDTVWATQFEGTGINSKCLRISKIELGDQPYDFIEIQNVTGQQLDATGWVVAASNSYTDVNLINTTYWNLGVFQPNEIQFKTDNANTNYWGTNLLFNPGSASWAMILDNNGQIVDFVVWDYPAATIQTLNTNINGFQVTLGSEWIGDGFASGACATHFGRQGNSDNNDANDWVCVTDDAGIQYSGLITPFPGCGIGCQSDWVPVYVPALNPVNLNLGNDTTIVWPNTLQICAQSAATYIWNNGATTQCITVSTSGQYTCVVTNTQGCSETDTIVVSVISGISDPQLPLVTKIYPQPTSGMLNIDMAKLTGNTTLRLYNSLGAIVFTNNYNAAHADKTIQVDVANMRAGWYNLQIADDTRIMNFPVLIK